MTLSACDLAQLSPSRSGNYEIVDQIDFPRCMKPVGLTSTVEMMNATIEWKVFPDAEKYIIEFYNTSIPELSEPDPSALVKTVTIGPKEVPYVFKGDEDVTYYYRVRSTHEGKEPSKWSASDKFTTESDPSIVCTRPREITITQVGSTKVKCTWDTYPDTEYYVLEVYTKSIPDLTEPAVADRVLTQQIAAANIPAKIDFTQPYGTYYYRLKACNPESGRRDSKWVKGTLKTAEFAWPNDPNAFKENYTQPWKKEEDFYPYLNEEHSKFVATCTVEMLTYYKDTQFSGDRASTGSWSEDKTYAPIILPKDQKHISFLVNCPGRFSFIPRTSQGDEAMLTIAILTNKEGEGKKAQILYDKGGVPSAKAEANRIYFVLSEELLWGITEPAKVFIYSSNKKAQQVYPVTWEKGNF